MDFLLASGKVSKARRALRQWNRENPGRVVAWEWVEEAVIAHIKGRALLGRNPAAAEENYNRSAEYVRKLPADLVALVFEREEAA